MVDWDEDGLKDLIVGDFSGRITLFSNIGSAGEPLLTEAGFIQAGGVPILVDYSAVPFVDDWDNDGRKDLQVGNMDGRIWLYLNEGTNSAPVFNDVQYVTLASGQVLEVYSRSAPCVVDLNGDGLKDLVVGQLSGDAGYYQSIGENPYPQLMDAEILRIGEGDAVNPGPFSRFSARDWDGDGQIDLIGGPQDAQVQLFRQIDPGPLPPPPLFDFAFWGPTSVPDSGGFVSYTCEVENVSTQTMAMDLWIDVLCPDERMAKGVQSLSFTLEPGGSLVRNILLPVPAAAPSGYYSCNVYNGIQRRLQVYADTSFHFMKMLDEPGDQFGIGAAPQVTLIPNPFNPSTVISFELRVASCVTLAIYDAAGREVTTLLHGWRDAGVHEVTFDGSGLASGVYFYRLDMSGSGTPEGQATPTTMVGKMVLVK